MEEQKKKSILSGIPAWLLMVLCGMIILMTLAISFLVLLHLDIIRCVPANDPDAEATPTAEATQIPTAEPTLPSTIVITPDPALPEYRVTPEPTEEPTPSPTPEPEVKEKDRPTSFKFGGKTIQVGETKIDGKSLGINGKKNSLRHIKKEEVQNLVTYCPNLEELLLDYCYMDNYEPLGKLKKLRKLQLTNCNAGNGKPIKSIDWIDELTELRSLNLAHNRIDTTTAIVYLKRLTYLNLSDNPLEDEDLIPIGKLSKLETLYLYDLRKITDVEPLAKLSRLSFLHIGHNSKLTSVKQLTSLKKLAYLRVNCTAISNISYFGDFPALKKLDIAKCPIMAHDYYYLDQCTNLRKIVLDRKDENGSIIIDDMINNGYPFEILYNWSE